MGRRKRTTFAHFIRLARPVQRKVLRHFLSRRRQSARSCLHRRINGSRRAGVHPDPEWRQLRGGTLRQPLDSPLACAVRAPVHGREDPPEGAHIHDDPAAVLFHIAGGSLRSDKVGIQIRLMTLSHSSRDSSRSTSRSSWPRCSPRYRSFHNAPRYDPQTVELLRISTSTLSV